MAPSLFVTVGLVLCCYVRTYFIYKLLALSAIILKNLLVSYFSCWSLLSNSFNKNGSIRFFSLGVIVACVGRFNLKKNKQTSVFPRYPPHYKKIAFVKDNKVMKFFLLFCFVFQELLIEPGSLSYSHFIYLLSKGINLSLFSEQIRLFGII